MAKASRSKKSPAKKKPSTKKKAASRAPAKKKATVKKPTAKTSTVKKTTKKKTVKKAPAVTAKKKTKVTKKVLKKKPVAKKTVNKAAVTKKTPAKKTAVKTSPKKKSTAKKAPVKKTPAAKKPAASKTPAQTTKKTAATSKAPAAKAADSKTKAGTNAATDSTAKPGDSSAKPARKGITIVSNRRPKRSRVKQPRKPFITPGGNLLGPGVVRKPLIPSGPSAPSIKATENETLNKPKKSPFNKRELMKFKSLLISKRAELFGDVEKMESDVLRSSPGKLSKLPQHLADQGSDSYDQSLSLDLAAADRRMIKEIDDALARIDAKTYGLCEQTAKPIRATRLQELPWARYSIETAREMERRGGY